MILHDAKILITGGSGLVGSTLVDELRKQGYFNLFPLSRRGCDLRDFESVKNVFGSIKPEIVFHNAATVYGIGGNKQHQASVFLDNVLINTHVIEASQQVGVKKIVAMGTVAAYPEPKVVPIKEEQIWDGPPHASESSYGHAKRAMLAQLLAYQDNYGLDYAYAISTNLYGPNDKFDIQNGHVIPSLIRKFYEAKKNDSQVSVWGDGTAKRDFLYAKDLARALTLMMNKHTGSINVASGIETEIKEVVSVLSDYFGMSGKVTWDSSMPNGRACYEMDLTHLNSIGFKSEYDLECGLKQTLDWFVSKYEQHLVRC